MKRSVVPATAIALSLLLTGGASAAAAGGHGGGARGVGPTAGVGVARGVGRDGRANFRGAEDGRYAGLPGEWGFGRGRNWRRRDANDLYGDYGLGWPYAAAYGGFFDDDYGYGGDGGYAGGYDGPGFGPQPPMGDSFEMARRYGPPPAPLAPYLAPRAYGPGPHDGAYTYGYNGHAETPPLPPSAVEGITAATYDLGTCNRC